MVLTPQPHRLVRNPYYVISVNNVPISEVNSFRFLGTIFSNNFSWKSQIESIRSKLRTCLGIIYKARDHLNISCLMSIFHSLASTHLNYCIITWCNTNSSKIPQLQSLCNRILRLIFRRHSHDNIDDIYKKYALLKIRDKFKFEICCLVYKFLHQMLPCCFNNFFQRNDEVHSCRTRQSNNLHPPHFKKASANSLLNSLGSNYGMNYPMKSNYQKIWHNLKRH